MDDGRCEVALVEQELQIGDRRVSMRGLADITVVEINSHSIQVPRKAVRRRRGLLQMAITQDPVSCCRVKSVTDKVGPKILDYCHIIGRV